MVNGLSEVLPVLLLKRLDEAPSVRIGSLEPGMVLTVRTRNSVYGFTRTVDGWEVSGGVIGSPARNGNVVGTALGAAVKVGHVVLGGSLVFSVGDTEFRTSEIQAVAIEYASWGRSCACGLGRG